MQSGGESSFPARQIKKVREKEQRQTKSLNQTKMQTRNALYAHSLNIFHRD
jgi:hypothetical protein